ncbi:MAG TPA: hypothetical protein VI136_04910 [Verrucomicrobiae bacterium]
MNWEAEKLYGVEGCGPFDEFWCHRQKHQRRYVPDFFVEYVDGKKEIVEVKDPSRIDFMVLLRLARLPHTPRTSEIPHPQLVTNLKHRAVVAHGFAVGCARIQRGAAGRRARPAGGC